MAARGQPDQSVFSSILETIPHPRASRRIMKSESQMSKDQANEAVTTLICNRAETIQQVDKSARPGSKSQFTRPEDREAAFDSDEN
jgi:hypothetical protein